METGEASVLAFAHEWQGQTAVTLHNLADRAVAARLPENAVPPELTMLFSSDDDRQPRSASERSGSRPTDSAGSGRTGAPIAQADYSAPKHRCRMRPQYAAMGGTRRM